MRILPNAQYSLRCRRQNRPLWIGLWTRQSAEPFLPPSIAQRSSLNRMPAIYGSFKGLHYTGSHSTAKLGLYLQSLAPVNENQIAYNYNLCLCIYIYIYASEVHVYVHIYMHLISVLFSEKTCSAGILAERITGCWSAFVWVWGWGLLACVWEWGWGGLACVWEWGWVDHSWSVARQVSWGPDSRRNDRFSSQLQLEMRVVQDS